MKPFKLFYEEHVIKKKDPFQHIYDRIKIVNGQKIIEGDVNLRDQQLTKLPDLHDVHVTGHFNCSHNSLTSLEGAPIHVGGDFYCKYNQLTSLKGSPRRVGGYFDCMNNQLTSLKYSPMSVGEYFFCTNNQLTSLEDGPESVGDNFYCDCNPLPKGTPTHMTSEQYQEYRKKLKLQKEFGNDAGQTIYDL